MTIHLLAAFQRYAGQGPSAATQGSLVLSILAYLRLSPTSDLQPQYKGDTTPGGFTGRTLTYRHFEL